MNFEKYKDFSVEELLEDHSFRNWLKTTGDEQALNLSGSYLSQNPSEKAKIQEAISLLQAIHAFDPSVQNVSEKDDFTKVLKEKMQASKKQTFRVQSRRRWIKTISIAASFLLILGLAWSYFNTAGVPNNPALSFETTFGEWKNINLPDGSKVKLNANSQLKWMGGNERVVQLKGEAFFDVVKNAGSFKVLTDDLTVQVLGTSFNVNTHNQHTEVFLEEGKVNILLEDGEEAMKPGDFFSYTKRNEAVVKPKASESIHHRSWTNGVMILKERQLSEVLQKVENVYGKTFKVEASIAMDHLMTTSLPIDNLEVCLQILEEFLKVKIDQEEQTLIIRN